MSRTKYPVISEWVETEVRAGGVVDVHKLASLIRMEFPDMTLKEITDIVFQCVIEARGNASWTKEVP